MRKHIVKHKETQTKVPHTRNQKIVNTNLYNKDTTKMVGEEIQ